MYKGRITLLVLLYLTITTLSQNCGAPTPATDMIDAGKVSLVRRGGNRQHCFTVNINYNIPLVPRSPDIAISTSRISGYNPISGFDYSVTAARKALTNSIGITIQIAQDSRWASMEVSYLVSSNPNFIVGSLIASLATLTSCSSDLSDPTTTVETYVPTFRLNSALTYKVSAFISGFRTLDNSFLLKLGSTAVDKVDGRVVIQIQSNAAPSQQYVFVTYFVMPTTPINNIDYSITQPNSPATYEIEGIAAVYQSGSIQYGQFTICNRNIQCPANQDFVNGKCECAARFIKVNDNCERQCMPNAYINQQRQCICVPGFRFAPSGACIQDNNQGRCNNPNQIQLPNGQCGCKEGYYRNQNACLPYCTLPNQMWTGRGCDCMPGFTRPRPNQQCVQSVNCRQNQVLQGGICICQDGFVKNANNLCVQQVVCKNNEINIGGRCQCQNGYFTNIQGICIENCKNNQQYNPKLGVCECFPGLIRVGPACINQCGINGELKGNGICGCINGYGLINNICTQCPNGSQASNNNCVCRGNTVLRATGQPACVPCPLNSAIRNGECVCNPGLQFNGDRSACIPTAANCPVNGFVGPNGRCVCNSGFTLSADGRSCNSLCPPNARFDPQLGCVCVQNYEWSNQNGGCVLKNACPLNSKPNNGACICNQGFRWNQQGNNCVSCPADSTPGPQGTCFCNRGFQWSPDGLSCDPATGISCPPNSNPNSQGRCVCNNGFQFSSDGRTCVPTINCPQNAFPSPQGTCVCNNGLYLDGNTCKSIPTCPPNSAWDQSRLVCVCQKPNQNLIGGLCKQCPTNQFWNLKECVCNSGLFRIGGSCQVCDPASTYNGTDCVCNRGYFGNRNSCQACHSSCGTCTGPESNKCLTCVDISLQLANGYCSKNSPCQTGYYLNGETCSKCSDYCIECATQLQCGVCSSGFQIDLVIADGGLGYSFCKATCGDGKKVDIQKCDDGNKKNGDGCSTDCTIQDGWSCGGGTSVKPSICTQNIPTRSTIQVKGAVNMVGKVVQGVRLSYIPPCFAANDCANCFKILDVKVFQSNIQVLTTVNYIPNSDGQFLIEYTFGGVITSTFFKYQIQLNKNLPGDFANCFSAADYTQQVVGSIDSATLALNDQTSQLSLGDLLNPPPTNNTPVQNNNNNNTNQNGAFGYSKKVLDLIFKK